jgi:hypothetical protein
MFRQADWLAIVPTLRNALVFSLPSAPLPCSVGQSRRACEPRGYANDDNCYVGVFECGLFNVGGPAMD